MAFLFQIIDEIDGANFSGFLRLNTRTSIFEHCQRVQRNIRACPGIRGRRQVVSVSFAGDFKYCDRQAFWDFRTAGEPLAIGPALHHSFSVGVALQGFFFNVMKSIKHQQGFFQTFSSNLANLGVVKQFDHGANVVAAQHGTKQLGCLAT